MNNSVEIVKDSPATCNSFKLVSNSENKCKILINLSYLEKFDESVKDVNHFYCPRNEPFRD